MAFLDPRTGLPRGIGVGSTGTGSPTNPTYFTNPAPPPVTGPLGTTTTPRRRRPRAAATSSPFDVQGLLQSLLNPIQADLKAQGQVDLAGRNSAINRALVQFGAIPDFGQAQQALGPEPRRHRLRRHGAARQREPVQRDEAACDSSTPTPSARSEQALAAKGLLQSGDLGFQLNREQQQYGQAQYDANQQLLDYINSYQQGYLQAERARQAQLANYGNSALQQLLGLFPGGLPGSKPSDTPAETPPPPPPAYQAPVGSTATFDTYNSGDALNRYLAGQLNRRGL